MKKTTTPIVIFESSFLKTHKNNRKLNGISNFVINSLKANFNFRFRDEPYMLSSFKEDRRESIAGHMWGVSVLWLALRDYCPKLSSLVNSEKIFEILLCHDLGEIIRGDTPIYEQYLTGESKKDIERKDLEILVKDLSKKSQKKILENFDKFENIEQTTDLEILVARLMDSLQGSFFVFAHGNNLVELADLRNVLTKKHFGGVVERLFKVLDDKQEKQAKEEIKNLLEDHIKLWSEIGVKIRHESYFS